MIKFLVEQGIRVNEKDLKGNTAVHIAASAGFIEIVEYFSSIKASFTVQNKRSLIPMHSSIIGDDIDTFELCKRATEEQIDISKLEENDMKIYIRNPSLAVRTRNKLTPLMLSCDVDLNEQDDQGYTALHHAISKNDLHKARMLLQFGADPKIRTYKFSTSSDLATKFSEDSDEEVVKENPYENITATDEMKKTLEASLNAKEFQLVSKLSSLIDSKATSQKLDYNSLKSVRK